MDIFSVELWTRIFQDRAIRKLRSHETLLSVSRTCRLFHAISQPELYDRIYMRWVAPESEEDEPDNKTVTLLSRTLSERPELAALIHTVSYVSAGNKIRHHPFLSHLATFTNLRRLHFYDLFIDARLLFSLHSLHQLKETTFSACELDPTIPEPNPSILNTTRSLDLAITETQSAHRWAAALPIGLRSLSIKGYMMSDFTINTILSDFMALELTHALTTLQLYAVPSTIALLLISSPQLRRISFEDFRTTDSASFSSLPAEAIPLLEEFSGPIEFCDILFKGRPVHTAKVQLYSYPMDISPVRLSSVPIRDLTLLFQGDQPLMHILLHNVPSTLQRFAWTNGVKECLMFCVPILARLPDLLFLRGNVSESRRDRAKEFEGHRDIVQAFFDASVSLQEIVLREVDKSGSAHGRWVKSGTNNWEYYRIEDYLPKLSDF